MEATAKRIGKSKNEKIIVDGKVYIKSCLIGKWNFLVVTEGSDYGDTIETKHRDIHTANLSMNKAIDSYARYKKSQGGEVLAAHSVIEITRD
jgi:hypothetical protein